MGSSGKRTRKPGDILLAIFMVAAFSVFVLFIVGAVPKWPFMLSVSLAFIILSGIFLNNALKKATGTRKVLMPFATYLGAALISALSKAFAEFDVWQHIQIFAISALVISLIYCWGKEETKENHSGEAEASNSSTEALTSYKARRGKAEGDN